MIGRFMAWLARDWALKLTSLVIAFLLWITVRADAPGTWQAKLELRVINADPEWVPTGKPAPDSVLVRFRGPLGELLRVASERPHVIVPIDNVNDSSMVLALHPSWVRMPPGAGNSSVDAMTPDQVRLSFDPVRIRVIPIAVGFHGQLTEGFRLAGPVEIEPSAVRASGAQRDLMRIDSLRLSPIDLRDRRVSDTLLLMIDTTGTGLVISPRTVRVVVPIEPTQPIQPIRLDSAARRPLGVPRRGGGG